MVDFGVFAAFLGRPTALRVEVAAPFSFVDFFATVFGEASEFSVLLSSGEAAAVDLRGRERRVGVSTISGNSVFLKHH